MNNKEFNIEFDDGVYKQLFLDFIRYQRSLGYKYGRSALYTLRSINRDLNQMSLNQKNLSLSKKTIESLVKKRPTETSGTQQCRTGLIRQFSLYMNSVGHNTYLIPKRFLPKYRSDFRPYIFSDSEISAIINHQKDIKSIQSDLNIQDFVDEDETFFANK